MKWLVMISGELKQWKNIPIPVINPIVLVLLWNILRKSNSFLKTTPGD